MHKCILSIETRTRALDQSYECVQVPHRVGQLAESLQIRVQRERVPVINTTMGHDQYQQKPHRELGSFGRHPGQLGTDQPRSSFHQTYSIQPCQIS